MAPDEFRKAVRREVLPIGWAGTCKRGITSALGCWAVRSRRLERAMFDRITFDPQIIGGRACLRGMRITVADIVGQVAHGAGVADILADYPSLEEEDIRQALGYAAWLTQED